MKEETWDYSIFWKEAMNHIREELSEQEWIMWFSNMEYHKSGGSSITVRVPSTFYRDQVQQRYLKLIESKLAEISGHKLSLEFFIQKKDETEKAADAAKTGPNSPGQAPPDREKSERPDKDAVWRQKSGLNGAYNFDQYVIGENNTLAVNASIAIANNPGSAYNPCLIYGGVGLGKTHLIQAIGNSAHEKHPDLKIVYVTAETFTNEFINAIQNKKTHIFKNKYRSADILLIDDIHFFADGKKESTQEELFHTFNALYDANKQMVFTCDRPALELKELTDRLRSRFARGLNADLQPPSFEIRAAILKKKLQQKNAVLSDDVIHFICSSITSNVRDLEAALLRLIAYSELVKKEITLDIAREQLKDNFSSQKAANISINTILRAVADYFNMSQSDIKGKRRNKAVVLPRQIAMYITRELTEFSTTEIGLEFGGRDHTTVMHACQRVESYLTTNPTLEPTIRSLIRTIKSQGGG